MEISKKFEHWADFLIVVIFAVGITIFVSNVQAVGTTYYYNNVAMDGDWNTVENWYLDSEYNGQSLVLPENGDHVYIEGDVTTGPDTPVTLENMFVAQRADVNMTLGMSSVSATGMITMGSESFDATLSDGVLTGAATFYGSSSIYYDGTGPQASLHGDGTFYDTSGITSGLLVGEADFREDSFIGVDGSINGEANFYDNGCNIGHITGNARFDYYTGGIAAVSDCGWGEVSGIITGGDGEPLETFVFTNSASNYATNLTLPAVFYDTSANLGTITGDPIFYESSQNNNGTIIGNPTFYNLSLNLATVTGDASFHDSTVHVGTVSGDACFDDGTTNGGQVDGTTYEGCPEITTTTLLDGTDGEAYTSTIMADNIRGVVSYTLLSGSLPSGLNFSGNELTGTPSGDGEYTFEVRAIDTLASGDLFSEIQSYTITIEAAAVPDPAPEDDGDDSDNQSGGGSSSGGTGGGVIPPDDSIVTACNDGKDNDNDGRTDYPNDWGCDSATDSSEINIPPVKLCADGIDNDGDHLVDYGSTWFNDPGCYAASDNNEYNPPICADGIDNDADGKKDFPLDPGCLSAFDNNEENIVDVIPVPVDSPDPTPDSSNNAPSAEANEDVIDVITYEQPIPQIQVIQTEVKKESNIKSILGEWMNDLFSKEMMGRTFSFTLLLLALLFLLILKENKNKKKGN